MEVWFKFLHLLGGLPFRLTDAGIRPSPLRWRIVKLIIFLLLTVCSQMTYQFAVMVSQADSSPTGLKNFFAEFYQASKTVLKEMSELEYSLLDFAIIMLATLSPLVTLPSLFFYTNSATK